MLLPVLFPVVPQLRLLTAPLLMNSFVLLISWPHLAITWDRLFRNAKVRERRGEAIVAGIFAPVIIAVFLFVALQRNAASLLTGAVVTLHAGTLFHLAKQTYGLVLMSAAREQRHFTPAHKRLLHRWVLSIAVLALVLQHARSSNEIQFGVVFQTFHVLRALIGPAAVLALAYTLVMLRELISCRMRPTTVGLCALSALVLWILPGAFPIPLVSLIAITHALQGHLAHHWHPATPNDRRTRSIGFLAMCLGSFAVLWFVPTTLGRIAPIATSAATGNAWMTVCVLTIHLHHVYADRFAWRGNKPTAISAATERSTRKTISPTAGAVFAL